MQNMTLWFYSVCYRLCRGAIFVWKFVSAAWSTEKEYDFKWLYWWQQLTV